MGAFFAHVIGLIIGPILRIIIDESAKRDSYYEEKPTETDLSRRDRVNALVADRLSPKN